MSERLIEFNGGSQKGGRKDERINLLKTERV
jgi:hypothetical protein